MIKEEEIEAQRYGRNKNTIKKTRVIDSGEYQRAFDDITDDKKLSKLLCRISRDILNFRSGTRYESMFWIDADTHEIIAKENKKKPKKEKCIVYSKSTEKAIKKAIQNNRNIITIHNHPDSFPPSIEDFNSNYHNNYFLGIVICHDGTIYIYSSKEEIRKNYYELIYNDYKLLNNKDNVAQLNTLNELQRKHKIKFLEVFSHEIF